MPEEITIPENSSDRISGDCGNEKCIYYKDGAFQNCTIGAVETCKKFFPTASLMAQCGICGKVFSCKLDVRRHCTEAHKRSKK